MRLEIGNQFGFFVINPAHDRNSLISCREIDRQDSQSISGFSANCIVRQDREIVTSANEFQHRTGGLTLKSKPNVANTQQAQRRFHVMSQHAAIRVADPSGDRQFTVCDLAVQNWMTSTSNNEISVLKQRFHKDVGECWASRLSRPHDDVDLILEQAPMQLGKIVREQINPDIGPLC